MKGQAKNIILVVVVTILIFIGYTIFFGKDKNTPSLVAESQDPALGSEDGKVILNLLLNLKSLKLEAAVFDRTSFLSLIDFGQEIPDRPKGRDNPFAPLGKGSISE